MKFEIGVDHLDPVLEKARRSRDPVTIIAGPLGSGKTYMNCLKVFEIMCEQKPDHQGVRKTRFIAVRNTFSELLTTIFKDFEELFGDLAKITRGGSAPPEQSYSFRLPDKTTVKSEIIFIALDRPQATKKLRGIQATGGILSEAKELDKAVIDMLDLRVGRYPSAADGGPSWFGLIADTNMWDEDHWLHDLHTDPDLSGWNFCIQPGGVEKEMRANPQGFPEWTGKWLVNEQAENVHNLPKNYYTRGMEGKSNDWISLNLANIPGVVMEGNPVYREQWHDLVHVTKTIQVIEESPIIVGLDFGLTPSAIIGQETPMGFLNILEEVLGEGMGIEQFVTHALKPILNTSYKNCEWNFVGDPSGTRRADTNEKTVFKVLDELGMNCEAANTNDLDIRFEAVRGFLTRMVKGKPVFNLHPRCKIVRKGFNSGYHFKRVQVAGEKRYVDKPNKNKYSHPHDALQYLCMWINGDSVATVGFDRSRFNRSGI